MSLLLLNDVLIFVDNNNEKFLQNLIWVNIVIARYLYKVINLDLKR